MSNPSLINSFLTGILGIAIGFVLCSYLLSDGCIQQNSVAIVAHDTILIESPAQPIVVEKIRAKVIRTSDTVVRFNPFIAQADTIIMRDTIKIAYQYPDNFFSFALYPKPDTSTIISTVYELQKESTESWWEKPLYFLAGMALGSIIGGDSK